MFIVYIDDLKIEENKFKATIERLDGRQIVTDKPDVMQKVYTILKNQFCISNVANTNHLKAILTGENLTTFKAKWKTLSGDLQSFEKEKYFAMYSRLKDVKLVNYTNKELQDARDFEVFKKILERDLKDDLEVRLDLYNNYDIGFNDCFGSWSDVCAKLFKAGPNKLVLSPKWSFSDKLEFNNDNVKEFYTSSTSYRGREEVSLLNCTCKFTFGGLKGAINDYETKGAIVQIDVSGFYPSLALSQNWLSRNIDKEIYKELLDERFKKNSTALKLVLNRTIGLMNNENSIICDIANFRNITINGACIMGELIQKSSGAVEELIQVNTDGAVFKVSPSNLQDFASICKEWEQKWGLKLKFDVYTYIKQKDMNNYILRNSKKEIVKGIM